MEQPGTVAAEPAALALEVDGDGVAWLTFDQPDGRVNVLSTPVMVRLNDLLGEVEDGVALGRVRAVVVRSGKPGSFIVGADVREIAGITDPAEGEAKARAGQEVFQRLARLPVPTVAAVNGTCLGGGTELALACRYRLAADAPETRIGLPEVRLGILPGFGGTTRLPRLIGLRAAVDLILTGRTVNARRAARLGLVDEAVHPAQLEEVARRYALDAPRPRRRRRGMADRFLDGSAPGRLLVLRQARRQVMRQTRGHYPAPLAALDTIAESAGLPLEKALAREAAALGRLIATPVCKNLIHVFFLMEGAKKPPAEASVPARAPERVAVLGAGVMGGGIAQLLAARGVDVRMKDIRAEALSQGLKHARELFDKAVRRRKLDRREAERAMDRIAPSLDYTGFGTADVVIEAVVERMDVKQQVLREVEERARPGCVLASNTSALSITEMQHAVERPESLCGMHFFNPVHRMPLVEIVRGAATTDETVGAIFALARRLDKTPLVVNDGPGFLVNRVLAPYLNEAGWLLADGATIDAVDRVLLDFGMPMGPFRLLDEVGLDVARHVAAIMFDAFGDRMRPAPSMVALEKTDRLGRKGGRGFYRYEDGREKGVDASVYSELGAGERRPVPDEAVRDRAVLVMVNEAARALEDGIVASPGDVDLAMIAGTGFPPFRGGLLRWADSLGVPVVLERLEALEREHGPRFHPAPRLRELAESGRGFY